MKATARPQVGKGAARATRRTGRVPGVIYGDKKPPLPISLDLADVNKRIYDGHFLTTVYELDVEGEKHRVIPRAYQLDPVKDRPVHVDFQRLGAGATIRVHVPVRFVNQDASPGLKRGGTLNIVRHTVELYCPAENIPENIIVDLTGMEIAHSLHISAVQLPEGSRPVIRDRDFTIATIVSSSGYLEEQAAAKAKAEADAAAAAIAAAAAPGEPGAAPVEGAAPAEGAAAAAAPAPEAKVEKGKKE
jgi:large subunit ribosomal protein L25